MSAHAGADTRAGELAPDRMGGAAFETLHQDGDRQDGRVGDKQVHVVGFAVELDSSTSSSAQTARIACSQKVSTSLVNTGRRYLVNTRCACSSDTLCRARR